LNGFHGALPTAPKAGEPAKLECCLRDDRNCREALDLPAIIAMKAQWPRNPKHPSRIADNKKAAYNYFFEERHEAGMVLQGWEVKALREGKVQITDGYVVIKDGELFLIGCQINPLRTASTHVNPEAARTRKLLLQEGRDPAPDWQGRAKGLHPGAAEPALEKRLREVRNRPGQGQGRARQARHHQGPRRQARGRAGHEEPQPLTAQFFCRTME
jgi:hypothetical protein